MQLVVLGLNHKTAPVDIRECYSFTEEQIRQSLKHLWMDEEIQECVILSTCNRTEMYAVVEDAHESYAVLVKFLQNMSHNQAAVESHLFYHVDSQCIRHLFEVASSLDSLVIGEGQILSQVKTAYRIAKDVGTTRTVLNTLFNRAIAVGKRVRTETRIAYHAVSISYAAVELAKQKFHDLTCLKVLLIGAGQMGELTARHLAENGVQSFFICNRSFEGAKQLAKRFQGGQAVSFSAFMEVAAEADIIITSTGAPHYIIASWDVAHLMPKREGRPLVFIDIAVPRDVEPEVGAIKGVELYNIDDLEAVVETNLKMRQKEAETADRIIREELSELMSRFRYLSYRPVYAKLQDKAEAIRQREIKRALAKLPAATPEERRVLENLSKMIVRKLLRDPIMKVNEAAGTDKESFYLEAMKGLFKLGAIEEEGHGEEKSHHRYARQ